jgi:hypothetical protein
MVSFLFENQMIKQTPDNGTNEYKDGSKSLSLKKKKEKIIKSIPDVVSN